MTSADVCDQLTLGDHRSDLDQFEPISLQDLTLVICPMSCAAMTIRSLSSWRLSFHSFILSEVSNYPESRKFRPSGCCHSTKSHSAFLPGQLAGTQNWFLCLLGC